MIHHRIPAIIVVPGVPTLTDKSGTSRKSTASAVKATTTPKAKVEKPETFAQDQATASAKKSVAKRTAKTPVKASPKAKSEASKATAVTAAEKTHGIVLVPSGAPAGAEGAALATEPAIIVAAAISTDPIHGAEFSQQLLAAIRWRAYELYVQREGRNGSADHDWAVAEREVRAEFMQRSA